MYSEKRIHEETVKDSFINDIIHTVIDAELEKEEVRCQYRRDRIDANAYEKVVKRVMEFKGEA